jgi:hypothetical protein
MQATIKSNVPEFSDSAWGSLILQDVIDMTSGIDCRDSDGYQNTGTCVYRAEEVQNIVPQVQKNFLQPLPCQKVCRLIATQVKKQNIPPRIR